MTKSNFSIASFYHLVVHYLEIPLSFNLSILEIFREFKISAIKFYKAIIYLKSSNFTKHCAMNINFNLAKKHLCLKKGTRGFHASAFWRNINTLIARVEKSCRTEAHKRLQNLKEKNMKIVHILLLVIIGTIYVLSFF